MPAKTTTARTARTATTPAKNKGGRPAKTAVRPAAHREEPAMTVVQLGAAIAALETLPPVEQARQAGLLFDVAQRLLPRVRRAAVYKATRTRGSYDTVADELGLTRAAINYLVTQHGKG